MSDIKTFFLLKPPSLKKGEVGEKAEKVAQSFVKLNRIKITNGEKTNFVKFETEDNKNHHLFTIREITDEGLAEKTKDKIKKLLEKNSKEVSESLVEEKFLDLKNKATNAKTFEEEFILGIARAIAQSTNLDIIKLAIIKNIKFNIDLRKSVAAIVPSFFSDENKKKQFFKEKDELSFYIATDGDPIASGNYLALTSLVNYSAYAFGTFSDLRMNDTGQYIDRHSSDLGLKKSKELFYELVFKDIELLLELFEKLKILEILHLVEKEVHLKKSVQQPSLIFAGLEASLSMSRKRFLKRCDIMGYDFILDFAEKSEANEVGVNIHDAIKEAMEYTIPIQKNYLHKELDKESFPKEQVALHLNQVAAKMPVLITKWGKDFISNIIPHLYDYLDSIIIPECRETYIAMIKNKSAYKATEEKPIQRNEEKHEENKTEKIEIIKNKEPEKSENAGIAPQNNEDW